LIIHYIVLFSVLVLHWVTSIDKKQTTQSDLSHDREAGSRRKSTHDWQDRQRTIDRTQPTVTTCVSGKPTGYGSNYNVDVPLNEIQVMTEQTQVVEVDGSSELNESTDMGVMKEAEYRREGSESMEIIINKRGKQ
jgi:hypothetical protein